MKRFMMIFALVVLAVAGGVAYFADSDPDGLDAVTQQGCSVVQTERG
ncbi:MAG: PDGLE domain-containing protein, partial [Actinomycetota bacterium]|nr:PDGLE domain-containing protein [Actinomycetota bacterium]